MFTKPGIARKFNRLFAGETMKKIWLALTAVIALVGIGLLIKSSLPKKEEWKEQVVEHGPFRVLVSSSASIAPENKVQIIPPVSGRVDSLLVDEGQHVNKGQVIAWVSSTDRAALLDAAHAEGDKAVSQWESEYKATPIISPVDGVIVNRPVVVSQTITATTVLYEISDRLVVSADVDETDLAKIHLGQRADISVDSFPDMNVPSKIIRIAQQSTTANNITVYKVLLAPEKTPKEFRSGMTATVRFVILDKKDALTLPTWMADGTENGELELFVKNAQGIPEKRKVKIGSNDGEKIEVLGGLTTNDIVMYHPQNYLSEKANGGSPFMFGGAKKPGGRSGK